MNPKILLVDDEAAIRTVLDIYLTDAGYEVHTAEGGEAALNLFKQHHPPIVITDIKMPGMDGIDLLRAVKTEDPETEVIMITGHGDIDLAIQSLKHEAVDFVTKPINDEVLEIALKRAEEKIEMRRQLREYTENLEQLVEEKSRQLVEAERMAAVGETVAGMAHAIKNITGGLRGGIFVLEKGMELDNRKYLHQGWEMLKGNLSKIKELALNLLSLSKEHAPDYQLCAPNDPAEEVFELMRTRAEEYGVNLTADLDDTLPRIWMDPEAIHRALLNLVSNAIDACADIRSLDKPGTVRLHSAPLDGGGVEYEVIDNGCGMEPETQARVFQRFFTTKGTRGTGLGLMITKRIVDGHQGDIRVESQKGKGSRFVIRLPGTRPADPDAASDVG